MRARNTREQLRARRGPSPRALHRLTAGSTPERQQEVSQAWLTMAAQSKANMIQDARAGDRSLMRLHRSCYRGAMRQAGWAMPRSVLRHGRR